MLLPARIAAVLMALLLPFAALAQGSRVPDDAEIVASVWCDTQEQLETVLTAHYAKKVPMARAMAEINRDNPEACIFARAIVSLGTEVGKLTAGDTIMSLRSAMVHGIMRGQYALMMRPQTWYYMRVLAELVPI